jgi:mono/diheme cytochrome c family protein
MFWVFLFFAQSAAAQSAAAQSAVTAQIQRGEALFFASPPACGTCHSLKGRGTAIGPDLKGVARLSPAGLAMAIRSTVTQYVQSMKVKSAGTFPAMTPGGDEKTVKVYDLSKMPPEVHEVDRSEISMSPNNAWKHPPSAGKYTDEQIADLIAYVRYAGAGSKTPVDPADVK